MAIGIQIDVGRFDKKKKINFAEQEHAINDCPMTGTVTTMQMLPNVYI